MKLESSRLYVIDVDLELMPMQRQSAPGITGHVAIIASSAGNVQNVTKKQTHLKLSNAVYVRLLPMLAVCKALLLVPRTIHAVSVI